MMLSGSVLTLVHSPRLTINSIITAFTLAVAPALPAAAQNAFAAATTEASSIIQADLASKVPGLTVAVSVDGKLFWSRAFGQADLAKQTPVTPATRFRIGSVSKPLTAAGLALLVERGQLDLDAPIQRYIPDFPQKGDVVITPRLLAGHLSGIRNYRGSEAVSNKPYPSLRSGLKIFEDDPLLSPPGTKFSYSSYNWNVLGVAMETAAKQDFLAFMADNVFKPLGLTNTGPDLAGAADPQRTQFYERDSSDQFIPAPPVDSSYKWPSGGFLSTSEDLVRFGSALLRPGFLKPETRRMLFTSQATLDGKLTHYGVGWFVGQGVLFHEGDAIGGTAVLLLHPVSRTVVAIVCNRGNLVIGGSPDHPSMTQQPDLNLVATAVKLAKAFAPLPEKP
jgi:serine beta-lactamase-like protein LACTB